jgi:Stress responsive A/B Barrel Domain
MIAHIVLFNPKRGLSADDIRLFACSIQAASANIQSVQRAMIGPSRQVGATYEDILGHKSYRFAAVMEFASIQGLKDYLVHPLHVDLGRMFWDFCESTVISDVELTDAKSLAVVDFLLDDQ